MARLRRPVMMRIWRRPAACSSSTTYWTTGLRPTGSISLGCDLVAGSRRVPSPAAGRWPWLSVESSVIPSLTRRKAKGDASKCASSSHSGPPRGVEGRQQALAEPVQHRAKGHVQHLAARRTGPARRAVRRRPAHPAAGTLASRPRRGRWPGPRRSAPRAKARISRKKAGSTCGDGPQRLQVAGAGRLEVHQVPASAGQRWDRC